MARISGTQKLLGIILALVIGMLALVGIGTYFPTASNEGYAPEQPIPFSHKIHAGINKIDCQYCHSGAQKSRHAGIPELSKCMNCHSVVRLDSPHIQKLRKAFSEGKSIEWIRVHKLPNYVYFPHKRHVAKDISCETCHGNVKEMDRIEQKSALTMGWCMECHRGQTTPRNVLQKIYPKMKDPKGPVAPVSCNTCHN